LLLSSVPEMDPDWLDVLVERRRRGELPTSASLAWYPALSRQSCARGELARVFSSRRQ